ncbi:MAG: phosphatase PAP2 family protein [Acidobacteriota bacterium]
MDIAAIVSLSAISVLIAADRGLSYDQRVAEWIQRQGQGRPLLDKAMFAITHFGDTEAILLATAVFAIILIRLSKRRRPAVALLITLALAFAINNGLKFLFARSRPQLSALIIDPASYSYPSGHAMISTAVYGCTAILLSEIFPKRRWLFRVVAAVLVFGIGLSRVYLDAHWPSDVLGGFAAGWITVSAVHSWYLRQPAPR